MLLTFMFIIIFALLALHAFGAWAVSASVIQAMVVIGLGGAIIQAVTRGKFAPWI
jgi:phage-related holin